MIAAASKTYHRKVDLAQAFDTSQQTIDLYTRKPDFPGGRQGPWEHDAVAAWMEQTGSAVGRLPRDQRRGGGSAGGNVADTKAAAEALKMREQYRKLKLANDEKEGNLVPRDEIAQRWNEGLLRIKHRLEAAPDEMAMTFPDSTRTQNVSDFKDFIFSLLREMANWKPIE